MVRAWMKLIWISLLVAVVAAAAQLGIADALGIIRWSAPLDSDATDSWSALLTWVGFSFTVAVLAGASTGRREASQSGQRETVAVRVAAAACAGLGGAAAVSLVWLLARDTAPPVSGDPQLVVTITAGAGVLAGVIIALLALASRPVAGAVRVGVAWVWLVGIGSAVAGLTSSRPYESPRLGVVDAPSLIPVDWWSGPYVMVALSALFGFAVAGVARWGGARRWATVASGLVGPAVVAAAYLIAGPGTGAGRTSQFEPYQASLIAIVAGLGAAAAVALPRSPAARRTRPDSTGTTPAPVATPAAATDATLATSAGQAHGQVSLQQHSSAPSSWAAHDTVERPVVNAAPVPAKPAPVPAPAVMGQPPRSDDYSDWIKELGQATGRGASRSAAPH